MRHINRICKTDKFFYVGKKTDDRVGGETEKDVRGALIEQASKSGN